MNTRYTIRDRCSILTLFSLLVVASLVVLPLRGEAAEKLSLSVTPPLFQLYIGPGESWTSSVKMINTNPYDLEVYASVMNFEASGETGQGRLSPLLQKEGESVPNTLARWIHIAPGPFFAPREKSVEIPFSLRIPNDAPPGGHYAAILVGTAPPSKSEEGTSIQVSSLVSSLIFVRVKGDVVEKGDIREFTAERTLYQKPDVTFTLRFENKGNVHLQPQGDITIYNMWGKKRGEIPVNQKTEFGNVLPQSIRKFGFNWQGEDNLLEVGRYTAVATLAYGKEARANVTRIISFWVVPVAPVSGILGGIILVVLVMVWAVRAYIRKSLILYSASLHGSTIPVATWIEPARKGVIDLRAVLRERSRKSPESQGRAKEKLSTALFRFLKMYRTFFFFLIFFLGVVGVLVWYMNEVRTPERSFDVTVHRENGETRRTPSEEVR